MHIAEWQPPSINKIKFKAPLCGLLTKMLSQEIIREPGGPVEMLEEPQAILTSLQAVHQDAG